MAKHFHVSRGWVPGSYLLKVKFEAGNPRFVHLTREELEELKVKISQLLNPRPGKAVLGNHPLPPRKLHVT